MSRHHSAYRRERRFLQGAIVLAACVPVGAGAAGMLLGVAAFDRNAAETIALDSHVRYLSGLLFGLGVSFWCMIPAIERHTVAVRILTCMVVVGGLARLSAALMIAAPSIPMQIALGMELVVTPLLCLWQTRIASRE